MAKFKPSPPVIRFREQGRFMITEMILNPGPGITMGFKARVDMDEVERRLRVGEYDEISGIFGSIFKGIKGAVKGVAKATGLNKVVDSAKTLFSNKIVQAFVPGAGLAAKGASAAQKITRAIGLSKKGKKKKAKKYLRSAAKDLRPLDKVTRGQIMRKSGQIYNVIVASK